MRPPLRTVLLGLGFLSTLNPQLSTCLAQGTAFTYQGHLTDAGAPANGIYDLRFTIYDAVTNGSAVSGVLTNAARPVTNGLFIVALDFGAVFDGNARWLEIGVRPNGSAADFNTLSPRHPLTPTPYAIRAANFSGPVAASQLTGTISSNNIGEGSITTVMLAAGAVGSNQLASGAVNTTALTEGAVTAAKVATVSNWFLALTITNPTPAPFDGFGGSVAVVGSDQVLIGAPYDNTGATQAGVAYLLSASGALITTFTNPTPRATNWFGESVTAVGTGRVLIGAPADDRYTYIATAAYLFSTNGALLTTFTNPAPTVGGDFGHSVAAVGTDRVLIGAQNYNTSAAEWAYLFAINGTLLTTFTNPAPANSDFFGVSVAAVGVDRVLIAAPLDDTGAFNTGAAYLFSTKGALLTTFTNPTPAAFDNFGSAAAAVGTDRVLIGAPDDNTGASRAGAAYLLSTDGALLTTFTNPTPAAGDLFGRSVAAVGTDRVLIGAPDDNTGASRAGAAYLFSTNGALLATFTSPTPAAYDHFGWSVAAVDADRVLIGTLEGETGAGAAYLFSLETYTPSLVADGVKPRSITTASLEDGAVTAAKIGGVLFAGQIPELDASKIASGLFAANRIPNLDASKIVSGTLSDARLSAKVALLNGTNVFTGTNQFAGVTLATNANNRFNGSFTGNGGGLTNLNSANLTGTISSNNIAAGSITTKMLAAGAVGSNQLASGAVTTGALADGAVTAAKVATVSNWFALTIANPAHAGSDYFGYAVAAVGTDRVLIGADYDDTGAPAAGAAHLFSTSGELLTTFTNPTPEIAENFGWSVAAVGTDRVLIGSHYDGMGASGAGAAYLFSTNGAMLTTFTNPAPAVDDYFSFSVAAVGTDRVLIGAHLKDTSAEESGVVYLFSTNGVLLTTFSNPTPAAYALFGHSVAAVGTDRVLIGAPGVNTGARAAGAAYLFSTNGALLATFLNLGPAFANFGSSVAAVGTDRVLIGRPGFAGGADLFSTNGALLTTFINPTPSTYDFFGYPVAAVGTDRVLIGAQQDDTGVIHAGAAYLFSTNGLLLTTFTNPTPAYDDHFGYSLAAVGTDRVLIGAFNDDTGAYDAGAAYLFSLETYAPGLVADGVNARSITTASLEDGAVTLAKLDPTIGVWTRAGDDVFRPAGNVGIGTSSFTSNRLEVAGMVGATAFNTTSDRAAKQDFTMVDAQAVLAKVAGLLITQWRFKELPGALHLGPMAQDFRAAFGLGYDDKTIATVDADGVALAAIQGLNQKLEERSQKSEVRSQELEAKNAALEKEVAELKRLIQQLSAKLSGGAQ